MIYELRAEFSERRPGIFQNWWLFLYGSWYNRAVPDWQGGGSAYGGKWKPSKPADEKFIGKPGEIKQSFTKKGDLYEAHIGPDGKADSETLKCYTNVVTGVANKI